MLPFNRAESSPLQLIRISVGDSNVQLPAGRSYSGHQLQLMRISLCRWKFEQEDVFAFLVDYKLSEPTREHRSSEGFSHTEKIRLVIGVKLRSD